MLRSKWTLKASLYAELLLLLVLSILLLSLVLSCVCGVIWCDYNVVPKRFSIIYLFRCNALFLAFYYKATARFMLVALGAPKRSYYTANNRTLDGKLVWEQTEALNCIFAEPIFLILDARLRCIVKWKYIDSIIILINHKLMKCFRGGGFFCPLSLVCSWFYTCV